MKEKIATIQLNPRKGGYFDEVSRVHLTHGNPRRDIYAGTNCTNLLRAVKNGTISLVWGSLGKAEAPFTLKKQGNRYVLVPNKGDKNKSQQKEKPLTTKSLIEESKMSVKEETVAIETEKFVVKEETIIEEKPSTMMITPEVKNKDINEEQPKLVRETQQVEENNTFEKKTHKKKKK